MHAPLSGCLSGLRHCSISQLSLVLTAFGQMCLETQAQPVHNETWQVDLIIAVDLAKLRRLVAVVDSSRRA